MTDSDSDSFCYSILSKYPVVDVIPGLNGSIGVVALLVGLLYFFNSGLTIYWIKHQKFNAEMGVERAARHVVFPVYVPFMWASSLSDIFVGITILLVPLDMYDSNTWSSSAIMSMGWALQHLVTEGVAFLLMQYGCGMEAAKRSFAYATIWGVVTFLCSLGFSRSGNSVWGGALVLVWTMAMLIFYGVIWLAPETSLFRRQALVGYSRFWTLYLIVNIIASCLLVANHSSNVGQCFYFFGPLLLYILCKPYVVYWALLSDSIWWQGVYQRAPSTGGGGLNGLMKGKGGNTSVLENLVSPLFGIEVGFDDAQELGRQVDVMRTEGQVKLLNFAYLSLDKKRMLGCGSFSKVYRGKYRGTPVAIKLLFTVDLNPDIIKRCSKEAQLLSMITHPNVVEIFGVSVLPPSVCIVLEICQYGSLSDVIRGSVGGGVVRRALPLTHADRMYLALGCAKGLQALHNYSPTLCHRDVKSFNFLVDSQLNAKIADLELGGDEIEADPNGLSSPRSSSIGSGISSVLSGDIGRNSLTNRSSHKQSKRSGRGGDAFLCIWQSPEVLLGSPHIQASDVYALGLVLWEIISGSTPFSNYGRQDNIKAHIINGERPQIPRSCPDPLYKDIIEQCWNADYSKRPNIASVVISLRICWEGSLHRHLFSTEHLVDMTVIQEAYMQEKERLDYVLAMNSTFTHYRDSSSSAASSLVRGSFASANQPPRGSRTHGPSSNRIPPSPAVMSALSVLQQEEKLKKLDSNSDAVYVLVSPEVPYIVLWASTKFPQLTGYFLSDILCRDLSFLAGARTDSLSMRNMLAEAEVGKPGHRLVTMYRRDGSAFINSLHIFPIFVKFPGDERGYSTGLSRLLEEYIPPLSASGDSSADPAVLERAMKIIEDDTSERMVLLADDTGSHGVADSNRISEASTPSFSSKNSSSTKSSNKAQSGKMVMPSGVDKAEFAERLSTAKAPVLTTLSNGHQFVSSDIPNKVAYIALQFSIIQDLRS